jgi:disulfide bond formation protein DsbB
LFIVLILSSVHLLEIYGFEPCDLCLKQRWPWYISLVLAIVPNFIFQHKNSIFLLLISLLLFLGAVFAGWHAGIEWNLWEGPKTCVTQTIDYSNNLLEKLKSTSPAPQCNQASFRVLGLSLAGYNFLISFAGSIIILNEARKTS